MNLKAILFGFEIHYKGGLVFMESRVTDMTSGKPSKLILKFALPLMLGGVFQHLYTVVDAAIVGQFCGVNSLAALGSTDWLVWFCLGFCVGLTQGFDHSLL